MRPGWLDAERGEGQKSSHCNMDGTKCRAVFNTRAAWMGTGAAEGVETRQAQSPQMRSGKRRQKQKLLESKEGRECDARVKVWEGSREEVRACGIPARSLERAA